MDSLPVDVFCKSVKIHRQRISHLSCMNSSNRVHLMQRALYNLHQPYCMHFTFRPPLDFPDLEATKF